MQDQTAQQLQAMVTAITGLNYVRHEACLYHDLALSGDDAAELLEMIHARFGTRLEDLPFRRYFPHETEELPLRLLQLRLARLFGYRGSYEKLTFHHLVKVVEAGHWFAP